MNASLLQPEDSKRVADAIVNAIENETDFDIASAVGIAITQSLNGSGYSTNLGEAIARSVEIAVNQSMANNISK